MTRVAIGIRPASPGVNLWDRFVIYVSIVHCRNRYREDQDARPRIPRDGIYDRFGTSYTQVLVCLRYVLALIL